MPHLVILYTPNVERAADLSGLCQRMAREMQACRDEADQPVFPLGGIRVLAYAASHHAVGDGEAAHGFVYLNLRMARGRSNEVKQRVGECLQHAARAHLAPALAKLTFGVTLQIDEGQEVFDAKIGNLHAYFAGKA
jgi:5-carboxymethyl-2-hydroxymuconate isomerase